ncbi:GntR family transcriptional regulator [Streptantibioticus rubrisoli]|uniref:GntR family transcriptional regulator n=1 Tax=Streptantibioticus rubrisoli TaxID=1387313 RepID=A0ABT1PKZ9_9ACTN|nr:GntR family transcriptional regulator [Streptantibioticus rubrisoli]MCQ4046046.1 GntR family transcriptional regulator [Streptantibioticus rubrisoli]
MPGIERPGPLYKQVAAAIRDAITSGEFPPGSPLPSETQLIKRYQVSRPTVRNAIAALRAEGLIDVVHGKASYVRRRPAPALTIERTVTRKAGTYTTGQTDWQENEAPSVSRATSTETTGPALGLDEGEDLFAIDRLHTDPATGTRILHRTLLPLAVAADHNELAENPAAAPEQIYALLATAGHKLTWTETVRARMPLPDERATLELPDATPIIETTRITHGNDDQPLLLEELRAAADRAQLAYRITADSPRTLRAVRS